MINDSNIELYIFRYKECLLDDAEAAEVERALAENAEWRALADLYDPTLRITADMTVTYPDKERLMRKVNFFERITLWRIVSAAACVALAVGILRVTMGNGNEEGYVTAKADVENGEQVLQAGSLRSSGTENERFLQAGVMSSGDENGQARQQRSSASASDLNTSNIEIQNSQLPEPSPFSVTDQMIAYLDEEADGTATTDEAIGWSEGGDGLVFSRLDTILTDRLITYLDDDDGGEVDYSLHTGRSALGCAVEDWINAFRLKSTELQIALIEN